MARTGRPKKEIDKRQFENLLGLGCSATEICWFFRDENTGAPISISTLSRWCKRTYKMTFDELNKKSGGNYLKISLRRYQLKLAERNAGMAIFLGKHWLGQSDQGVVGANGTNPAQTDDPLTAAIMEELNNGTI